MLELMGSFDRLHEQFEVLYSNIENQNAVKDITEAMEVFSGNVEKNVKNT